MKTYRNRNYSKKKIDLLKSYQDIDPNILLSYKEAPKSFLVNEDPDLHPIKVNLPEAPPLNKIEGFGLPAKDQKFKRVRLPKRLVQLQRAFDILDDVWKYLDANGEAYAEEIRFIEMCWYKRLNGHWFFNNGTPTYIDGWHWFFLNFWYIDIGLPKYRDRDRKFFLFARMCYNDTMAFYPFRVIYRGDQMHFPTLDSAKAYVKEENLDVELIDEGEFFVDMEKRICFGFNYPKHRREGATYKAGCIHYEIISRTISANGGIQSMSEAAAKKAFRKAIISPWKRLPFFFKPNYEGSTDPKTEIVFNPPAIRMTSKGSLSSSEVGLESAIDYGMSEAGNYDGSKLHFHHHDEAGKLKKPLSPWDIHLVVKECLSTGAGSNIMGFSIKTSTVGDMTKVSGESFFHLCKLSDWAIRSGNGQTVSGNYNLFLSAYEGLEGHIDQYGMSVIEDPVKPVVGEDGRMVKKGSKTFLKNLRQSYLDAGDYEGLSEKIRQYPIHFRECFRGSAKHSGFNLVKLDNRMDELKFRNPTLVKGNFYWADGKDSRVEFQPNEQGKFNLSIRLPKNSTNRRSWDTELQSWIPVNPHRFVAGADPFKFHKTEHNRKSNGAGAVFFRHDHSLDSENDPELWKESHRFVCTYSERTYDKETYGEDMLMMCVFFGSMMFPEINVPFIWDYFRQRGYEGYLMYDVDPHTGKQRETPGMSTRTDAFKQDLFREYMTYIEKHIHKEVHMDLMEELRMIESPEDMTHWDLFTAGGFSLYASTSYSVQVAEEEEYVPVIDINRAFNKRSYG